MSKMEMYAPYLPQVVALAAWCACMALVAMGNMGTRTSAWMMLAGAGAMAAACLASGDTNAALSCLAVGVWAQMAPLFVLDDLPENTRTCATIVSDGTQVVLTMSMVAQTTYSGAYVCTDAARLAGFLAGFSLLASGLREHVGAALLGKQGTMTLGVAAAVTACVMAASPDRSVVVSLPGWPFASLTEAAIGCCAVALPACAALYAPPSSDAGALSRIALPAAMVAESCCMAYLGDAVTGIAFALAMAAIARAAGRSRTVVAVSLAVTTLATIGLSLVVPNMASAWRIWSGTMEAPFTDVNQARTAAALFSGDSVLLGCGVGRWSQAMAEAPYGVVWPLMMAVGTFGAAGLATLAVVATCAIATGVKAIAFRNGGASLPFLAVAMGTNLALGLLAALGAIPDLGNHGPMFLCIEATMARPVFLTVAMAIALGCDTYVADAIDEQNTVALLPPGGEV